MSNENTITIHSGAVSSVRIERPLPDYRLVRKNGVLALQRAYGWANGMDGGVDWRDEPTIDLDTPPAEL